MDIERFQPSHTNGLSNEQVERRIEQKLTNVAQDKITKTTGEIIRDNLLTLFNAYNFIIAVCLFLVGAYSNMFFIVIIITNIMIGIIQELHAKKMVENLSLIGAAKSKVIRDGKEEEIPVENLVLDDIAVLRIGDQICADSVVVSGEIEVNEALLTGESDPIFKRTGDKLLSGSFVVSGSGYSQIEHVGADNFVSKLTSEAKKHKKTKSELLTSMRKVTKFTSYFIIPIGILLFVEAFLIRNDSMYDSVVFSAAGLLGMLPKGLVLIISTSLVVGIVKMSKKRVLVQDLYALEMLAHVDTLCLDKTGTITEGKMCVSNLYVVNESILPITVNQAISCFIGAQEESNTTFSALKNYFTVNKDYNPIGKIPFSSERKWSAVTFDSLGTIVIGAPEKVFAKPPKLPAKAQSALEDGQRILCVAFTKEKVENTSLPELELIAAIELSDPIRKNAKETLAFFYEEGVNIKIISGDNPVTVSGIAKKAGFKNYESYIDMSLLQSDDEVIKAAEQYNIFGRVSPHQKCQVVKALQAKGHTVGMSGDGVNDVLALKESDCSFAIANGSDAARQVSNFVLLDSDFSAIPDMVIEGRRVVNNTTKFGGVFLIKTIYSMILAIISVITLSTFPFVPIQVTLYDFAVEAYPSFLLVMLADGRRINGKFLPNVISRAFPYAVVIILDIILISVISPLIGLSNEQSLTVMYYTTSFVGLSAVFKTCFPFDLIRGFVSITAFLGFCLATFLFPSLLHIAPLNFNAVIMIIAFTVSIPILIYLPVKLTKLFMIKFKYN